MSDEVKINNEALDAFLKDDLGDFLRTTKSIDETVKTIQVAHEQGLTTPDGVMSAIEDFLQKGSSVLDTMTIYCNNMPDAESVSSFASLITALSGAINNIAALYKTEQAHRNRIELEEIRHEHKLKELAYREKLRAAGKNKGENKGENENTGDGESETLVEVSTADIVNQIHELKQNNK